MRIRNIPYGYCFEHGKLVIHACESNIVKEIFQDYIKGNSLGDIVVKLNEKSVAYNSDNGLWNKARVKRIIDDTRYLGDQRFPPIIDISTFEACQKIKQEKNTLKGLNRDEGIYRLHVPVVCPICNGKMKRQNRGRWVCDNHVCHCIIRKSDSELLKELSDVLNSIIGRLDLIQIVRDKQSTAVLSDKIEKLQKEIDSVLDQQNANSLIIKEKILCLAELYYQTISPHEFETAYLKDILMRTVRINGFPKELFEKIVDKILIDTDGRAGVLLINQQEIFM